MKEISRRYPDETLTLEYSFSLSDNRKLMRTVVYKNGTQIQTDLLTVPEE